MEGTSEHQMGARVPSKGRGVDDCTCGTERQGSPYWNQQGSSISKALNSKIIRFPLKPLTAVHSTPPPCLNYRKFPN